MPQKFGKILALWTIDSFEKHNRTAIWYIGFGIIGLSLLIYGVFTVNYLFVFIILLAAFIVYMQAVVLPHRVKFLITTKGIKIGTRFYPYKDIRNFWILYNPPDVKKLYFSFKSALSANVMLPLNNQNPVEIRKLLLQFIDEDLEQEDEPISEVIGRLTKL